MINMRLIGYSAIMLSAFLYGAGGSVYKYITNSGVPPLFLIKIRLAITALVLFAVLKILWPQMLRIRRQDYKRFIFLGLFGFAGFIACAMTAASLINVGLAVFLQFLAPAFVAVYQRFFCGHDLPRVTIFAVCLSIGGGMLMVVGERGLTSSAVGIIFALASAVLYAFNTIQAKFLSKNYQSVTILFYAVLVAAIVWLCIPVDFSWDIVRAVPLWMYIYLILGYTLIPYALFYVGVNYLPVVNAGITAATEPVIASIIAFLTIGEILTVWQVAGGVLVLTATVILQVTDVRKNKRQA